MNTLSTLLGRFQAPINIALEKSLSSFGPKTQLAEAVAYSLKNGGKRFRPAIIFLVSEALGKGRDVTDVALAVEYFHTASLIADDLPCMDDDDVRREQPACHKVYGEATALLASYALIAAGYDRIRLNAAKLGSASLLPLAIENASYNTGIFGASGGQHADLFPEELTEASVLDVIDKKTGTLFELSFVMGWLFGGGDVNQLELVKQASRSFGRAFQISDDFLDLEQDEGTLNFPAVVGCERALEVLNRELEHLKGALKKLRLETPELLTLVHFIEDQTAAASLATLS